MSSLVQSCRLIFNRIIKLGMLRSIALKALWSEWTVGWFAFQWAFAKWHLSTWPSCVKGLFEDQVASYGLLICHNQWACWKSLDTLRIIYRGANILPECVFRARSVYPVTRIFNVTFSYTWRNEQFRATFTEMQIEGLRRYSAAFEYVRLVFRKASLRGWKCLFCDSTKKELKLIECLGRVSDPFDK